MRTNVDTEVAEEEILESTELSEEILELKRDREAIILAHNYQPPEIQDIADFTGDSLELAREASCAECEVIVFCGVYFMAETAYILSPEKKVLLPEINAGCPLADMATAQGVQELKAIHPGAEVVTYVNSSAEVKAISDCCCTSANALNVVSAVESDTVIFTPDRNLADYVAHKVDKRIIPWDGYCETHDSIRKENIAQALDEHPGALVIAHPECRREVLEMADCITSTSGMIEVARKSSSSEFIVATECGMLYPLNNALPEKKFYSPAVEPICPSMKMTTLLKVIRALETLRPRVTVPEEIRVRALRAVERMVSIG
ncbi:MAG: quinolinate synthase NadA [Actinomycetota bacterium]|nr:quinolinate synthase NadA [Actinomycetota bacterium]